MLRQEKNFGSFKITADGRVLVSDLSLLEAVQDAAPRPRKQPAPLPGVVRSNQVSYAAGL